jgi:hypothetical protein
MSIIDEMLNEADNDLYIDYNGNLGEQSSQNYKNFTKWLKRLKTYSIEYKKLLMEQEKLNSELWIYYTGKAEPNVYKSRPLDNRFLKSEVKDAINMDPEMQKLRGKILLLEEYVDTLERIVKSVKDRDWTLKNAIEWRKFESGI